MGKNSTPAPDPDSSSAILSEKVSGMLGLGVPKTSGILVDGGQRTGCRLGLEDSPQQVLGNRFPKTRFFHPSQSAHSEDCLIIMSV